MDVGWFDRLRYSIFGWKNFPYPRGEPLPPKPWHPDGDAFYERVPSTPADPKFIDWLARDRLVVNTGHTVPESDSRVPGIRINLAQKNDPVFTIHKQIGDWRLAVTTNWTAPYGATVRCQPSRMFLQGNPMQNYSDSKLHVIEEREDGTFVVTEIQNLRPALYPKLMCDFVTQYTLDQSSFEAHGASAAGPSLVGLTLRYDDLMAGQVRAGWLAARFPRYAFVPPAVASDGPIGRPGHFPDDPAAPPMGIYFRLLPETRDKLNRLYPRKSYPQLHAVLDCWQGPGLLLLDTSANNHTGLEPDPRWNQQQLAPLKALTMRDFAAYTA